MTSMALNQAAGLSGMLKSGHAHYTDSVLKNVEAANELSRMVATSLGPNGMNKLVVNHLEKIFVTSDCATIVRELEVEHPAARMLQMAAERQHEECGDATNLTVSFAGELLKLTEDLLRQGLHTSEVIAGYQTASTKLTELLQTLTLYQITNPRDEAELVKVISPVLQAKQYGIHDILAPLVAKACLVVMEGSKTPSVQPESVRVVKILGSNVQQSQLVRGYVAQRSVESDIQSVAQDAKIVVFGCGVEASSTEAKGTVLMKNAEDLKSYNKTEEAKMEEIIKGIADSGVNVIVTGGTISEMALHFINRYKMLCLKISSKWELRRLCQAVRATALVRLGPPTPDEMGAAQSVKQQEIGGRAVTIFEGSGDAKLATLVLRASTSSLLQDIERAIDDGVHAVQQACRDGRLVPGAGATEAHLSVKIKQFADTCPGLDQYAIRSFAKALEFVPRTLAENAGLDAPRVVADLTAAHAAGENDMGVDITGESESGLKNCGDVVDLFITKESAFRLAIDAALTVLKVDQIIMSKQAGGPKA
mmetsp:Transcript_7806/g.11213  ORF Transcript_7806/g.11213 Transcript_7806/m.11213 type:complete len:535 (+) Transcript_7806:198-1802(+)